MSSNKPGMIYRLIDAYFEGSTTTEEERLLKQMLASPTLKEDDEIRAARAVLGFAAAANRTPKTRRQPGHKWLIAAAMTGLSIAVCATLMLTATHGEQSTAVIYAQGRELHNVDLALAAMHSQLSDIGEANLAEPESAVSLLREFGDSWSE